MGALFDLTLLMLGSPPLRITATNADSAIAVAIPFTVKCHQTRCEESSLPLHLPNIVDAPQPVPVAKTAVSYTHLRAHET